MFPNKHHFYTHGFTLIEIIVTLVVLAIAATSLLSLFTGTVRTSADPMIQQQAISIAEAYMEEIFLKGFVDPNGTNEGETRASFDNVQDYNGLTDIGANDQNNNLIAPLSKYTVTVTVAKKALNGINDENSVLIDITVTHPAISPIAISAYRTYY